VGIVILVALYRLIVSVLDELLLASSNPLEPAVFQRIPNLGHEEIDR